MRRSQPISLFKEDGYEHDCDQDCHPLHCCCENCPKEHKTQPLISDQLCGNIHVTSGVLTTLWESKVFPTFGSVSVFHGGGCDRMAVLVNGKKLFTLNPGVTKSVTVPILKQVAIECYGKDGTSSTGKYCLDLHYQPPVCTSVCHEMD